MGEASQAWKVLAIVDRRRAAAADDGIGAAVVERILDRELRELEELAAVDDIRAKMRERHQAAINTKRMS